MEKRVQICMTIPKDNKRQIVHRAKTHGKSMKKTILEGFAVYDALLSGNFEIVGSILIIGSLNQSFEAKECQT